MEDARMTIIGQIAALLAAVVHVLIFTLESVVFARSGHRNFKVAAADVPVVRPWALNQGFYNLFLAVGTIVGLILLHTGHRAAGLGMVGLTCASMVAAALVLLATDRSMLRGVLIQGVLPLIALIFIFQ
jgi:putative membrane protein